MLGTLLGSFLTYQFQWRSIERTQAFTRAERLRQERLDAYSAFAGVAIQYRLALMDRWHRRTEDPDGEEHRLARFESYRLRTSLIEALFRVQLVADDQRVRLAADQVVDELRVIHKAATREEMDARSEAARKAVDQFVETGAVERRAVDARVLAPGRPPRRFGSSSTE
ncbi:hypothetical protein [Pseudonocardia hierapolitana]|uniref:hypothetical protein n=1 Tax=Pseudonocardia hierapolitana TaxID=1128676 RepID=UPI001BAEB8DF|nr:hypothetical protein [Pseudonocardia hierapolitana]